MAVDFDSISQSVHRTDFNETSAAHCALARQVGGERFARLT